MKERNKEEGRGGGEKRGRRYRRRIEKKWGKRGKTCIKMLLKEVERRRNIEERRMEREKTGENDKEEWEKGGRSRREGGEGGDAGMKTKRRMREI